VCGNYTLKAAQAEAAVGSPPRVRELQLRAADDAGGAGITPACAGITVEVKAADWEAQDHPRVCGNYRLTT